MKAPAEAGAFSAFIGKFVGSFIRKKAVSLDQKEVIIMYNNPYVQYQNPYATIGMRSEIIKVSGENGAMAYAMAPNSSALLLDETEPVVYLKTTDGAGYPTITAYEIVERKSKRETEFAGLEERIARLEALINESDIAAIK